MVESQARMLFPSGTTYSTDFQAPPLLEHHPTLYKEKKKTVITGRPRPLKDVHTMSDWKDTGIPFDLLIKPKEIIRTYASFDQKKIETESFEEAHQEAIRTRPRRVMTPAVSMDDIADRSARDILISDTYMSQTTRAMREAAKPYFNVKAPFSKRRVPAKPVTLPAWKPSHVPPEWRMETISWDKKQLRGHCDPDKSFWLEQQLKMKDCGTCKDTEVMKNHRLMQRQMRAQRR